MKTLPFSRELLGRMCSVLYCRDAKDQARPKANEAAASAKEGIDKQAGSLKSGVGTASNRTSTALKGVCAHA